MSSSATAPAIQRTMASRTEAPLFISRSRQSAILCLLLALATLVVYNPIIHNQFTNVDDDTYIVGNAHVRAGLTWATVKWAFTNFDAANWHPLTWLSHALDCRLFGLNPAGPHYVNLLLHVASAILLFLLLEGATGVIWPSFLVAALFALHPVNVESVAWAAERKNVLSMVFFLLTLHAYGWYVKRGGVKRYAVVAALFALGLMAKSEVITLPFVLLLWDYWPLGRMGGPVLSSQLSVLSERRMAAGAGAVPPRPFWFLFLEKTPLMVLSAASGVLTLLAQSAGHAVRKPSLWVRFGNAVVAYMRYLGKAFWPAKLAVLYPHPGALPVWEVLSSTAALIAITALVLHWRSHRYLAMGWFWMLGALVPVIGVVQVGVQAMADRYAYIPYIGLFISVVWGVAELTQKRKRVFSYQVLAVAAGVVLVMLGVVTRRQVGFWHDSETLWRHTLAVTQRNYMAHDALARALAKDGRIDEAIAEHKAAEKLNAYSSAEMINIGAFEQENGHVRDAIDQYMQAVNAALDAKGRAAALSSAASGFLQLGDLQRAKRSYTYALREDPDNTAALVGSGLLAEREGDFGTAIARMSHAAQVGPTDVSYLLLEQVLRRAGRAADADEAAAQARRISQDLAAARRSAAQVMEAAGVKGE